MLQTGDSVVDVPAYDLLVSRRAAGEPIAYITGRREFWSLDLTVTRDVLIPRPDSETLIEAAVTAIPADAAPRVLDLGTGSGALLLAALAQWPGAWGVGVDRSAAALAVAAGNAARLGFGARAAFAQGDWAEALCGGWDLVLANPPYVRDDATLGPGVREQEPAVALFAGPDGLEAYRRILPDLRRLLGRRGIAIVEIGYDQGQIISTMARAAGLSARLRRDLAGRERAVLLETDKI